MQYIPKASSIWTGTTVSCLGPIVGYRCSDPLILKMCNLWCLGNQFLDKSRVSRHNFNMIRRKEHSDEKMNTSKPSSILSRS